MKNLCEINARLKAELDQWYIRQCQNAWDDYYLYYLPTTAEHDGGIIICKDLPANPEYKLASAQRIRKEATVEANFILLQDVVRRLPVLARG